jgi:two-component system invasion response regulator UvrY
MNILIADDHSVVRKGLIQILTEEYINAAVGEASSAAEVYQKTKERIWDFILLDISMPGRSGVDILKQLRADGVRVPILILSMHPEEQYAIRVLRAGASGFVNKNCAPDELLNAVKKVLSGKKYITPSLAERLAEGFSTMDRAPHETLSDRELEVFLLLASGKTVSEIAGEVFLSVNTVSTYRTRILDKMNLANNAELTRYALDNGLLE